MSVKHGGCYECKSIDHPILISVRVKDQIMSLAVCPPCSDSEKYKGGKIS